MKHERLKQAHAESAGAVAAWSLVRHELKREFPAKTYQLYIEPLEFLLQEDDQLVFLARTRTQQLWLESEARRLIEQKLLAYIDVPKPIALRTLNDLSPLAQECAKAAGLDLPLAGAEPRQKDAGGKPGQGKSAPPQSFAGRFDTFQVGPSNARAFALARMAAQRSGGGGQLVLFHGEPGVGKTHLAEAICADIQERSPDRKVLMMKALTFLERFIEVLHVRKDEAAAFRATMRGPSVLVIDDVQHLAGKKITEDEFLAVLAHHLDGGSQVILTADVGPDGLDGFQDRLKHRLRCAVESRIELPDEVLRRAILDSRLGVHAQDTPGFAVEPAVLDMIAARMETSGRELDGAIGQLVLEWEVSKKPLTVVAAEAALRSRFVGAEKRIMIDHVRAAAAQHFSMTQQELLSRTRVPHIAYPRHVAMYVACKITSQSLPNIGKHIGGYDHTTVLHARRRITGLLEAGDEAARRDVEAVTRQARHLA
jgi:chromosomal replication initiator protein